ncbi:MAG: bacillithiol system redox-active protein YtxJ [Bacteroidetes bacterium]|nr:bacillithiol system redox-active protein YtxJ [Bacteroidota bacterium]
MNWINLQTEEQLTELIEKSKEIPQVIFKHSTRCSVSSMAKNRLDKNEHTEGIDFYYLDLIKFRPLSNKIAQDFKIVHQSPQVIIIKDGLPVYNESHSGIIVEDILNNAF